MPLDVLQAIAAIKKKEYEALLPYLSSRFIGGATGGIAPAIWRGAGIPTPTGEEADAPIAGAAAEVAGFALGLPAAATKAIKFPALWKGASSLPVRAAGRILPKIGEDLAAGALIETGLAVGTGEDIGERLAETLPYWAGFGALRGVGGEVVRGLKGKRIQKQRFGKQYQRVAREMALKNDRLVIQKAYNELGADKFAGIVSVRGSHTEHLHDLYTLTGEIQGMTNSQLMAGRESLKAIKNTGMYKGVMAKRLNDKVLFFDEMLYRNGLGPEPRGKYSVDWKVVSGSGEMQPWAMSRPEFDVSLKYGPTTSNLIGKRIASKLGIKMGTKNWQKKVVGFYKKKYGLTPEIRVTTRRLKADRKGDISIIYRTPEGKITNTSFLGTESGYNIRLNSTESFETQLGTLRHEIEHIIDAELHNFPLHKSKNVSIVSRKAGESFADANRRGSKGHVSKYERFGPDYLRRSLVSEAAKRGAPIPNTILEEFPELALLVRKAQIRPKDWSTPQTVSFLDDFWRSKPKGQAIADKQLYPVLELPSEGFLFPKRIQLSATESYVAEFRTTGGDLVQKALSADEILKLHKEGKLIDVFAGGSKMGQVPPNVGENLVQAIGDPVLEEMAKRKGFRILDAIRSTHHFGMLGPEHKALADIIKDAHGMQYSITHFKGNEVMQRLIRMEVALKKAKGALKQDYDKAAKLVSVYDLAEKKLASGASDYDALSSVMQNYVDDVYYIRDKFRGNSINTTEIRLGMSHKVPDGFKAFKSENADNILRDMKASYARNPGYIPHHRDGKHIVVGFGGKAKAGKLPARADMMWDSGTDSLKTARKQAAALKKEGMHVKIFTRREYAQRFGDQMHIGEFDRLLLNAGLDPMAPEWKMIREAAEKASAPGKIARRNIRGYDISPDGLMKGLKARYSSTAHESSRAYMDYFGNQAVKRLPIGNQPQALQMLSGAMHPDPDSLHAVRRLITTAHISLKPFTWVRNMLQTMTHGLGKIGERLGEGKGIVGGITVQPKVAKVRFNSYKLAVKAMRGTAESKYQKLFDRAAKEGVLGSNVLSPTESLLTSGYQIGESSFTRGLKRVQNTGGFFISSSDKFNRYADFAASILISEEKGLQLVRSFKGLEGKKLVSAKKAFKRLKEIVFKDGRDFVHETQLGYGRWNQPTYLTKAGVVTPIAKIWSAYRTYQRESMWMFARRFDFSKGGKGNAGGAIAQMAGLMTVAGVAGIPGTQLMQKMGEKSGVDFEGKLQAYLAGTNANDAIDDYLDAGEHGNGISKSFMDRARAIAADVIVGGPGYAAGVQTPGYFGLGSYPIGDIDDDEVFGIIESVPKQLIRSYDELQQGRVGHAIEQFPLRFTANMARAARWLREGKIVTPGGKIVLDERRQPVKVGVKTVGLKLLGAPSREEHGYYRRASAEAGLEKTRSARYRLWAVTFATAIDAGNPADVQAVAKALGDYNGRMLRSKQTDKIVDEQTLSRIIDRHMQNRTSMQPISDNEIAQLILAIRGTK